MRMRNGKHLKIDALATLFPPMAEEELARLKADIAAHGQLEPIWTYQGRVVDGRHRLRACRELGIEPKVLEYDGDGSVLDFVIAKNLNRRHLSGNQRALVAAKLANLSGGRPSKTARKRAVTQTDAAALLRVGRTTVQSARQVLDRGVAELITAVERDQVKVTAAAAIAGLDDAELAELVARGPKAIRQSGRAASAGTTEGEGRGRAEHRGPSLSRELPGPRPARRPGQLRPPGPDPASPAARPRAAGARASRGVRGWRRGGPISRYRLDSPGSPDARPRRPRGDPSASSARWSRAPSRVGRPRLHLRGRRVRGPCTTIPPEERC